MVLLATLILSVGDAVAQSMFATFVAQTNTGSQTAQNRKTIFYSNPLLLDNKPVNYADFSIISQGLLTVVTGNPETSEMETIPFRIYLRRNGKTITNGASDSTRSLLTVNVASVLAIAKSGDYLIIEPTRKSDEKARRNIKLKDYFFDFNLFSFLRKNDGC
ncbi:hypothetical protein GCM10027190_39920 [Spirosoma areae]